MERFPTAIYKYRDWENSFHKQLLVSNQLYTPTVGQLNDPFDSMLGYNYEKLRNEGLTKRVVALYYKEFGNVLEEQGYTEKHLIGNDNPLLISELVKLKIQFDELFMENRKKFLGIISFSKVWNNTLMWSHYANGHSGFCVGFKTERLINSTYFDSGCDVFYTEKYPAISPFDEELNKKVKTLFHKSKDWQYEEEYRMTKLFGFHLDSSKLEKNKIYCFDNEDITDVTIGCKISRKHKEEIKKICTDKKLTLYQIEANQGEFKLSRKRINYEAE